MTGYLFAKYIVGFNEKMKSQQRNVCLLIDNAPCHTELNLSHTKLLFLPPNTTAGTQPLDTGIIKNFKCKYRQYLLEHLICRMDSSEVKDAASLLAGINQKHAVAWTVRAWRKIKTKTIVNCYRHVGIGEEFGPEYDANRDPDIQLLTQTMEILGLENLQIEENLPITATHINLEWEEAIINGTNKVKMENQSKEEDDMESDEEASVRKLTFKEVNNAMKIIKINLMFHGIQSDIKIIE